MTNIDINTQISDYLTYYLFRREPRFAVMLKGKWGAGKSWFIQKEIKRYEDLGGKVLYVSLYGKTSTKDIEEDFFKQLHPVLGSKTAKFAGSLLKGVVRGTLKFDLFGDDKDDGSVNVGIPDINLPDYLKNLNESVLVFDDVERCAIQISELLGYINHFVEHDGLKVILIANEDEIIESNSDDGNRQAYSRIKEKLIGKTFEVRPELEAALSVFSSEFNNPFDKVVAANRQLIVDVYNASLSQNLRHLRQALMEFERIFKCLKSEVQTMDGLLSALLRPFLIFTFETRSRSITTKDIVAMGRPYLNIGNKEAEKEEFKVHRFLETKYRHIGFTSFDLLLPADLWSEIFSTGLIDAQALNHAIDQTSFFPKSQPDWQRLWHSRSLTDSEFSDTLKRIECKLYSGQINDPGIILHMVGMLIEYSRIGVYHMSIKMTVAAAKNGVCFVRKCGLLKTESRKDPFAFDTGWEGLGFFGSDSADFFEFKTFLLEEINKASEANKPTQAAALLNTLSKDYKNFSNSLLLTPSGTGDFYNEPILHYIDTKQFLESTLALPPEGMSLVISTLASRYKDAHNRSGLLAERDWLGSLISEMEKARLTRQGKISGFRLQQAIGTLEQGIKQLDASLL